MAKNTKTTREGIIVTVDNATVTVQYSKCYISVVTFPNKEQARKEYGKFRKGHKKL